MPIDPALEQLIGDAVLSLAGHRRDRQGEALVEMHPAIVRWLGAANPDKSAAELNQFSTAVCLEILRRLEQLEPPGQA